MSKLFYDHILELDELESSMRDIVKTQEERHELWNIIDEIIHHEVLDCIFDHLPYDHHEEFLTKFHEAPYDEGLIVYVNEKSGVDITEALERRINELQESLIKGLA